MSAAAFETGARVAGIVFALGFLTGMVEGPILGAVIGLLLVTTGRSVSAVPAERGIAGLALAVLAGALGVAALRWNTFSLGEIRGAQGVLGPTLLVDPVVAAVAGWLSVVACVAAISVWVAPPVEEQAWTRWVGVAEAVVAALAVATAFWGPAVRDGTPASDVFRTVGAWALGGFVIAAFALLLSRFLRSVTVRAVVVLVAAACVVAGAIMTASVV